jgi:hypothetical protein
MALLAGFIMQECKPGLTYERRLKRELSSGIRYDSIFMGIYLGMSQKEFYAHCWNLNKQGIIKQGNANNTVEYEAEELKSPATMNFYPVFTDDKIVEMPVRFVYNGWAPWNKKLSADSLMLDVLKWYETEYGNDFITVEHPEHGKAFVTVHGNRRITIYKNDEMYAWALFRDMSVNHMEE